jgi:hypothetical protein
MITATCRTPGCGNADAPIPLDFLDREAPAPDAVICGACGRPITDLATGPDLEAAT